METTREQAEALSNDKMDSDKTRDLIQKLEKKEAPFSQKVFPFGLGSVIDCLKKALKKSQLPFNRIAVVSGLSYPGRIFDYGDINSFQTTYGRAIPFSTGMKLANPKLNVIVVGSDQDLFNIGGSHFIQAARRNIDLTILCLNNQPIMLQGIPDDSENDEDEVHQTFVHGNIETFFNLPNLADMAGAVYVGRWTILHLRQLTNTIVEAISKKGLSFIEVLAPSAESEIEKDNIPNKWEMLEICYQKSEIQNEISTKDVNLHAVEKIIIGKFVDRERSDYLYRLNEHFTNTLGEKYTPYDG